MANSKYVTKKVKDLVKGDRFPCYNDNAQFRPREVDTVEPSAEGADYLKVNSHDVLGVPKSHDWLRDANIDVYDKPGKE